MSANPRTGDALPLALLGGKPVLTAPPPQYPVYSQEARKRVADLLERGEAVGINKLQPDIGAIEDALADYFGVPWALGTSTGHAALQAALIGLELTDGDEIITSPYSWGASVSCILHNNCVATFADVIEGTGLLDPASVRERLTPRTRAILVPHMFGNPADMTGMCAVARENGLKVIEDGSQAFGARHSGARIGSFGDASGFSANGVKPLAATEAGFMVAKNDETYWNAVVSTQITGLNEPKGRAAEAGFPDELHDAADTLVYSYRTTPVNAALMLGSLKTVDADNEVRRRHLTLLREGLRDVPTVEIPSPLFKDDESVVNQVVLRFDDDHAGVSKQTYLEALQAEGLGCQEFLRQPLHRNPRLSPSWSGPRVMWTATLKRAGYDATQLELPRAEAQVANYFNVAWNYTDYDQDRIGRVADVFTKVEDNLSALRNYERSR